MLAWVDCYHADVQMRHCLLSDCLVLILGIDVLEDLFGSQRHSIYVVAFDPQSWSVVIFIIGNVHIVTSELCLCAFQSRLSFNIEKTIFDRFLDL
jgi:hypothetical protein